MKPYPAFSVWSAFPLALLCALAALGGILLPSIYSKETAAWAAQGIGQDWVNLTVIVPALVLSGVFALRGSRRALLLLGGVQVYVIYSFVLYAFDLHFNCLFLAYCALLGLSFYALCSLAGFLLEQRPEDWFVKELPVRVTGIFQIAIGCMFGLLWLSEDIPALIRGAPPVSLAEVGLMTNPVHVLDLSIILPAFGISGVMTLKRRPLGFFMTPIVLSFGILMAIAIGGMILVMSLRGVRVDLGPSIIMGIIAVASATVLIRFLSRMKYR